MSSTHRPALAASALLLAALLGCGRAENKGEVSEARVSPKVRDARVSEQAKMRPPAPGAASAATAAEPRDAKQILFGDLHVHTTFSVDAFLFSLPLFGGEGTRPPADACDFARFCSSLDFFSLNDHAEGLSPRHWLETKQSVRECNAAAGLPEDPDIVAFTGWEWTQVGSVPEDHFGHKNVIFPGTAEEELPARPISARARPPEASEMLQTASRRIRGLGFSDPLNYRRYLDFGEFLYEMGSPPPCPTGVDTRSLPVDCHEAAETPEELFAKLDQWGFDSLVIPHGTAWGLYTPPLARWETQLNTRQHDPVRQTMVEIYSGHGSSEEYRDWRPYEIDADGNAICPEPSKSYEPCCWRAGEIVRARCSDPASAECDKDVREVQQRFIANQSLAPYLTILGTTPADWKDCGQCRDCFLPAFSLRPTESVQYALALTNLEDPAAPLRFRFGLIGSSDNHFAHPGTGYKELGRARGMTEVAGARSKFFADRVVPAMSFGGDDDAPVPPPTRGSGGVTSQGLGAVDTERGASFLYTGGLVAVHSAGRDRESIWAALKRNEVYGTSGDRILLWFDLLPDPGSPGGDARRTPMGSSVKRNDTPTFEVRAVGANEQMPGCPTDVADRISASRLERLCLGECYNPADARKTIERIEVVRIRPRARPDEPMSELIEDPWLVLPCEGQLAPERCVATFSDPEFQTAQRDTVYYVRAIQTPSAAVNAANMRCTRNADGACIEMRPCYGDYRTDRDEDCLAPTEERAWSSPIFVDWAGPPVQAGTS